MLALVRSSIVPSVVQAVVLVIIVVIATSVAWAWLKSYRNSEEDDITASGQLSFFREMWQRGELSETEFRSIKTNLGEQLRDELRSSDHQE